MPQEQAPNQESNVERKASPFKGMDLRKLNGERIKLELQLDDIAEAKKGIKSDNPASFAEFKKLNGQERALKGILEDVNAELEKQKSDDDVAMRLEQAGRRG